MLEKAAKLLLANLERLMTAKGWKAKELAQTTKISRSALYKIIEGTRFPNSDNLDRIAVALGVSVAELFEPETGPRTLSAEEALRIIKLRLDKAKD